MGVELGNFAIISEDGLVVASMTSIDVEMTSADVTVDVAMMSVDLLTTSVKIILVSVAFFSVEIGIKTVKFFFISEVAIKPSVNSVDVDSFTTVDSGFEKSEGSGKAFT